MFCIQCGTKNPADANFCKRCGREIDREEALKISEEEFAAAEQAVPRQRELLLEAYRQSEAGDLAAAVASCEEVIRLQPDSTDAHSLLSTLHERMGNREGAIAEREKVLSLNPGSIADREKLDLLRDGVTQVHPRKITSVRASARPQVALIDTPGGAALIAVSVTLVMLVIGGIAYYVGRDSASSRAESEPDRYTMNRPGDGTIGAGPPTGMFFSSGVSNPPTGASSLSSGALSGAEPPAAHQPGASRQALPRPAAQTGAMRQQPSASPARIETPNTAMMEYPNGQPGRFILPEGQPNASPGAQPSSQPDPGRPAEQPKPSGRIEIVVNPENGGRTAAPNPNTSEPAQPTGDPRSLYLAGQRFQIEGNYPKAIAEYVKALDGAGDEAPMIHQKIALCYYRTGNRESAISHYNSSIKLYKDQIGAGKNQEAANQGIRAAEAGIKACRS